MLAMTELASIVDRLGREVLHVKFTFVKYVKITVLFEHSKMKTYCSRPQKKNQDFVKGYNMASSIKNSIQGDIKEPAEKTYRFETS